MICVWTCDVTSKSFFGKMNSTLGSVVPLAMFILERCHSNFFANFGSSIVPPGIFPRSRMCNVISRNLGDGFKNDVKLCQVDRARQALCWSQHFGWVPRRQAAQWMACAEMPLLPENPGLPTFHRGELQNLLAIWLGLPFDLARCVAIGWQLYDGN